MSDNPPRLPSPVPRRRNSTTFLPALDLQATSRSTGDTVYLSTSSYTPRSAQFVEVPITQHAHGDEGGEKKSLQVPLTPSNQYLQENARFGSVPPEQSIEHLEVSRSEAEEGKGEKGWGPRWVWTIVWVLVQLAVFGVGVTKYLLKDTFTTARSTFGPTFVIARSAALVLHVDVAFILFPICRGFVSRLRRSRLNEVVPFEKNIEFHQIVAWSIVFWTLVHTVAHLVNFWLLAVVFSPSSVRDRIVTYLLANFTTGPGATGWLMILFLGVMCFFAIERNRKKNFERFQWSHLLFIPFFGCWQLHGMFCMIKPDKPPLCSWNIIGVFWKYILLSLVLFSFERILREYRARQRTWINTVIQHPSKVVEIQFKKEGLKIAAGQYILINCPTVSLTEWHPFSVTSAQEEDFVSVHIRVVGDFTEALAETLGCKWTTEDKDDEGAQVVPISFSRVLPRIMIDGPFGAASEDVLDHEVSILIGAGIGVTPFSSVLKHIWYQLNSPTRKLKLRKVYFFWICRDFGSFKWFQSLLLAIEAQDTSGLIEIHTYLTCPLALDQVNNIITNSVSSPRDAVTRLRAGTHYGRPNFAKLFSKIASNHKGVKEVGVFFCGPKPMANDLETLCKKLSRIGSEGVKFAWRKENF
ncbi:uncharacterized protein JCM6883_004140 [Sporobolomyces salmoneus]|uniref:uncharacterized protein n=1 Tax=Sporobolomyces salmoneus TaxID=183962 RepID=UPI0031805A8F